MNKIYVASSWRNPGQQTVVKALREQGHEVYDFRNPEPGNHGFHWSDIDPNWQNWDGPGFIKGLESDIAVGGFHLDWHAMDWADLCVMVLPCGASAHLEAGFFCGAMNKQLAILLPDPDMTVEGHSMSKDEQCSGCVSRLATGQQHCLLWDKFQSIEPELMYQMANLIFHSLKELLDFFGDET